MTGTTHLTLHRRQDLLALPQRLKPGQGPVRLTLALPGLSGPDRAFAEARLSALLSTCGCTEGAVALIAVLPLAIHLGFLSALSPLGWRGWAAFFGILVAASLLGKLVGLTRARRRLATEIATLLTRIDPSHIP